MKSKEVNILKVVWMYAMSAFIYGILFLCKWVWDKDKAALDTSLYAMLLSWGTFALYGLMNTIKKAIAV